MAISLVRETLLRNSEDLIVANAVPFVMNSASKSTKNIITYFPTKGYATTRKRRPDDGEKVWKLNIVVKVIFPGQHDDTFRTAPSSPG